MMKKSGESGLPNFVGQSDHDSGSIEDGVTAIEIVETTTKKMDHDLRDTNRGMGMPEMDDMLCDKVLNEIEYFNNGPQEAKELLDGPLHGPPSTDNVVKPFSLGITNLMEPLISFKKSQTNSRTCKRQACTPPTPFIDVSTSLDQRRGREGASRKEGTLQKNFKLTDEESQVDADMYMEEAVQLSRQPL